jgi:hypothetical protein
MQLLGAIYFAAIAAVVAAKKTDSPFPANAPIHGAPQKVLASGNPTPSQLSATHTLPIRLREDLVAASGRIEVHWKFSPDEGGTGGLWVQFYDGANPNPGQYLT